MRTALRYFLVLSLIQFCFSASVIAQITADFNADVNSGCAPLEVHFTNLSSAGPGYVYRWDLGDGTISDAVNPQTIYLEEGVYAVSLTVTYGEDSETVVKEAFITVHQQPSVSFGLEGAEIGCVPFAVQLNNMTIDPEGGALSYTWSFGDGTRSSEVNPDHTYLIAGLFDVTLVAENEFGCVSTATVPGLVNAVKPQASFGVDASYSCDGILEVGFTNTSNARPGFTSSWNFGDGSGSTEPEPSHLYEAVGNYSVTLTVTDDIGCQASVTRANLIQVTKTRASFTTPKTVICPGENIRFTNTSTSADTYRWRFGDGTTSTAVSPQKNFRDPGEYEVWLIAGNGTCTDSVRQVITVEHVEALFDVGEDFYCELPAVVKYINQSVGADFYEWRFGSGTVSTQASPVQTIGEGFPFSDGNVVFSDTLVVYSSSGCSDTYVKQNAVTINMPKVAMTPAGSAAQLSGCVPMNITFSDKSTYNTTEDAIVSRMWSVNGGPWQEGSSINVNVVEAAKVPVVLRVITEKGCEHTNVEYINAGDKVNVDFNRVGNYERCASETVMFEITSPEPALRTSEVWDYGDGTNPPFPVPFHNYAKTGVMNVSLTIYNNGCPTKVTRNNLLRILGPLATMEGKSDCNDPMLYNFTATVEEASSYQWDFGDGSPLVTNTLTPSHRYTSSGTYVVRFTAFNNNTGCQFSVVKEVYARQLNADFSLNAAYLCHGETLTLSGASSVDNSPFSVGNQTVRYLWLFETEGKTEGAMGDLVHRFETPGLNKVSLVVQDANGCRDTLTRTINVFQPEPDFSVNYELGCMPVTFSFTDQSKSEAPLTSWSWNFGDGATATTQNPSHDYTTYQTFDVSLKVTDSYGCSNTVLKKNAVRVIRPDASFVASKTGLCIGDTISVRDNSESRIVQYLWELSDGRSFTDSVPTINFANAGLYSLSLFIKDDHGCEETAFVENFFSVQEPPVADFTADITESNCYPLVVQFQDLSQTPNPGSWTWVFGENENRSEVQNPFFIYNRPGLHDVTLISRTSNGCADTIVKKEYIHVGGPYAEIDVADAVCRGQEVVFRAIKLQNVHDISWSFGDGYSDAGTTETAHTYTRSDVYKPVLFLRSDDKNTCNKAIVGNVVVHDLQATFAFDGGIDSGCVPFTPPLINNTLNADSYTWLQGNGGSSQEALPQLTYNQAGSYTLTLFAHYTPLGCVDSAKAAVTVFPLPEIDTSPDTLICLGDQLVLRADGGIEYLWSPALSLDNAAAATTVARPVFDTDYTVTVTDHNSCVDSAKVVVLVQQHPVVWLSDTTLIIGEELYMDLSDPEIGKYQWSPADNISCSTCPDPVFKAMETTAYSVAVTDVNECFTLSYPFNLTVEKKYSVDVPLAFTPNGDGINDKVFVKGWGLRELVMFRIFNRFGQVVYESTDIKEGWDGVYDGVPQPVETYTYIVRVRTEADEVLEKSGTLRLIR